MVTTSMQQLSETLQKRLASDQEAVQNQTSTLLAQHQSALNLLSEAALNTTKSVTEQRRLILEGQNIKLLRASEKGLGSLQTELQTVACETLARIKWLMLWPLISVSLLCVLMLIGAAAWSWSTIYNAELKAEQVLVDQQIKLKQLNDQFCSSPAGKKTCISSK